jgi:hypothetical protein
VTAAAGRNGFCQHQIIGPRRVRDAHRHLIELAADVAAVLVMDLGKNGTFFLMSGHIGSLPQWAFQAIESDIGGARTGSL